ncbi:MAG: DUF4838 domain-containing protein, partial [Armatimonadetes bacterium]|nr:DUF4838 domain-containing protein [Armatimonadota bacterium]
CKMNRLRATEIRGWLRVVKPSHLFWGDFTDPMDNLPQPTASVIVEDAKWFHTTGMGGFMVGATPTSWPMLKLDHYVAAKVAWDANSTYEDLLEDYCRDYFGSAAAPMKGYYQALDLAVQQSPACFVRGDMTTLSEIFSPRLMLELKGRISEAQRLAGGNQEVTTRVAAEKECYTNFVKVLLGKTDVEEPGKTNLLSNPGFEEGQRSWSPVVQRGRYDLLIDTSSHSGRGSARAFCVESGRAVWQQVVHVEKGTKYHFSAWAKAEGKPPGTTLLWLHQGPSHLTGKLAYLEAEAEGQWRRYIIPEITTLDDTLTVFLMSDDLGTIWFDDLVLQQIEK